MEELIAAGITPELILGMLIFAGVWIVLEILYELAKPYLHMLIEWLKRYMPSVEVLEDAFASR